MENLESTTELQEQANLIVTEEMRSYFYEMAKWASFLAIVGFIFSGITIIGAFTIGSATDTNPALAKMWSQFGTFGQIVFTIINLVVAFAIFYPSLLLFKYSSRAKYGVLFGEQASLNEAFAKLKALFKYWGIITILFVGLYILLLIMSIMTGFATR